MPRVELPYDLGCPNAEAAAGLAPEWSERVTDERGSP